MASMNKVGEINLRQVILEEKFREEVSRIKKQRIDYLKDSLDMASKINELEDKINELIAQKRQFDSLLTRWAREINDVELKDDVMRFLLGDISCDEPMSEVRFKTPSPEPEALQRTRTCPPAPKRSKIETE